MEKKNKISNNETAISNPFDKMHKYLCKVSDIIGFKKLQYHIHEIVTQIVIFYEIYHESDHGIEIEKLSPAQIHVAFKEDITRIKKFNRFLKNVLPEDLKLDNKLFTQIRANLIPTSRIPMPKQKSILNFLEDKDQIILLDQEQEKIARKIGSGHRLTFGVAGSGKTVMLLARARFLALRHSNWNILILCYNRYLSKYLSNSIEPSDYDALIQIETFHAWARNYIRNVSDEYNHKYIAAERKAKQKHDLDNFFSSIVPELFQKAFNDNSESSLKIYDAILIDEAQDFDKNWIKCVMKTLNPKTNSLFITCDGLQGIYAQKHFQWKDVGIKAVGRTKYLRKSYRNPIEIGKLAQKTITPKIQELISKLDEFLPTEAYLGIHGQVELIISNSRDEEYDQIMKKIKSYRSSNKGNILILFYRNWKKRSYKNLFFDKLKDNNLSWMELDYFSEKMNQIFIGTFHGSKGLEADTVIIPKLDDYNEQTQQLLYVGITRAKRKLLLSASKKTRLIESFQQEIDSNFLIT